LVYASPLQGKSTEEREGNLLISIPDTIMLVRDVIHMKKDAKAFRERELGTRVEKGIRGEFRSSRECYLTLPYKANTHLS